MAWWDRLAVYKRITLFATMISAVIAALFAVANVLQAGEPHWIATRSFVRMTVAETSSKIAQSENQLKTRQVQTELQVLQGRVEAIKSKISDRELLLQQPDGPPQYKNLISQQVDEFKERLKILQAQTDDLRRELAGRQP